MTIIVTGGAGFIGSNFIFHMLRKYPEYRIVCLDKLTYAGNLSTLAPVMKNPSFRFVKLDICDRENVYKLFKEERPDIVVNFVAESHVDRSIENPEIFLQTNIIGTSILMDACRKYGNVRFHQVSTDEVYGDLPLESALLFTEDEPIDYKATLNWLFHRKVIGVGRKPKYLCAAPDYTATGISIHRSYLTRIDETSFSHDVIVIANIDAHCCGQSEPMTQWYRFRTVRTVNYGLSGELEVTIYNPKDAVKGYPMLDSLAPDIPHEHLDNAVTEMLAKYYDKALRQPCKIDVYELANNMGYTVQEAFLSEDRHIRGRVIFDEMELSIFDPVTGKTAPKTIKGKTILIDPAANVGTKRNFTEDTIVHEYCHIFWHQPFQKLQLIHREYMEEAAMDCDLETILHEDSENNDLSHVERQARAMTPRFRMPTAQTAALAQQYHQENNRIYYNSGRAAERTVSQIAAFYGTSKEATKNRLKELGDSEVDGILVYCNGHYQKEALLSVS